MDITRFHIPFGMTSVSAVQKPNILNSFGAVLVRENRSIMTWRLPRSPMSLARAIREYPLLGKNLDFGAKSYVEVGEDTDASRSPFTGQTIEHL